MKKISLMSLLLALTVLVLPSCVDESNQNYDYEDTSDLSTDGTDGDSDEGDGMQEVTIEDRYTLVVPDFLTKATGLNDEASLQYQNLWKEFYVIVIDESKEDMQTALEENGLTDMFENNLDGYTKLVGSGMEELISGFSRTELKRTEINGMEVKIDEVRGTIDGTGIYYVLGTYASDDWYYQVFAWTLSEKEAEHKDQLLEIMNTLKEVGKEGASADAEAPMEENMEAEESSSSDDMN